ncbi:lactococcin 972 family bacteriocin [Microbacterium sp. MYb45]|uniref:lactococcin 972 family bacteriocin n=1 Tax=Microbacterium sp. MYb45 TaxID=1827294 RepID=UPI000CFF1D01|nr:lactococcin 972 family bacteriocin [Microbacterium sp. MYb45]PRB57018.1 hypothetical protein CQ034_18320 [Microbacterium sp. MYb45]
MRVRVRNIAAGIVVGALLAAGGASAASATTTYPEGGTHKFGVYTGSAEETHNYSNYYHPKNWHRSSVTITGNRDYKSSDQPRGVWSKIDKETGWTGNKAWYYRYTY